MATQRWLVLCLFLLAGGAQPASARLPVFTEVSRKAGIRFVHTFGDGHLSSILEATGSGCIFFDYDNDGRPDIYAVNGTYLEGISEEPAGRSAGATNALYRNRGDGTFAPTTKTAGAGDPGYGMGAVAADYDNDGFLDLYVTNYGPNALYRNQGDGTFAPTTKTAGAGDPRWSVGAAFFDYDRDGDLDLFVGNYLEFDPGYRLYYEADQFPGPLAYPGQPDALYRNEGDGTFAEESAAAGLRGQGRAMGVTAADYDNDGWPDLFVANDAMENYLYRNQGDGTFVDEALSAGVAFAAGGDASSSMGGEFGDFDGDGDLDLFVPDMGFNNLYLNRGEGRFEDRTAELGIAEVSGQYASWHGEFLDYDNDGFLDLFISNGDAHRLENTQEPLLLRNVPRPGGGRAFEDLSLSSGEYFGRQWVGRGAAAADYDGDGDLDLFVLHLDQPAALLRNDGGNAGHWLLVELEGRQSNRDGVGARVQVRAGARVQTAHRQAGGGYLSQSDGRLHFGLGASARAEEVVVHWPAGGTQRLGPVEADQVLHLVEPREASP